MEKVYLTQGLAQAEKPVDVPWDTRGFVAEGDFIRVIYGDFKGKEGYVKAIGEDSDIIVAETSREAGQPPILFSDQQTNDDWQQVDIFIIIIIIIIIHLLIGKQNVFTVSSSLTYLYDRVQLFDFVEVVNGTTVNRTGNIVHIRANGYVTVKEIAGLTRFSTIKSEEAVSVFISTSTALSGPMEHIFNSHRNCVTSMFIGLT